MTTLRLSKITPENDEACQKILAAYFECCKTLTDMSFELPTLLQLELRGVTRAMIRAHYGNISRLHQEVSLNHREHIQNIFVSVGDLFKNRPEISKKRVYIVTTAVGDTKAHLPFLASLRHYSESRGGQILILPCESTTNSFENDSAIFDSEFSKPDYTMVTEDVKLNKNLFIRSIQVSANQIKPIAGLSRIGPRESTYVFASPKQFLEFGPRSTIAKDAYAIMTTGACTLPKYDASRFTSRRLAYIAENDHCYGALVIEIEDDDVFHFRHIQADREGKFVDLGVEWSSNSHRSVPVHGVYGDIHASEADFECVNAFSQLLASIGNVKSVFLHDIFNGSSISHHIKDIGQRSLRAESRNDSLMKELEITGQVVQAIQAMSTAETVYVVKSNHDEWLDRYLREGRYVFDPQNHRLSLQLAAGLFENEDLLEYALRQVGYEFENTVFLNRSSSAEVGGCELAAHGDLGTNGAAAGLDSLERTYGSCVVGHTHTGAIQRQVYRVGTFTGLDLGYNRGPSTWSQTGCLVYENGQKQLVNFVNGRFHVDA